MEKGNNLSKNQNEEYNTTDEEKSEGSQTSQEEFESPLGKKEYWDKFYSQEIDQFKNNSDLIGEVWFGENVQDKIVKFIISQSENRKNKSPEEIKILDIGCGNAALLIELYESGFKKLYGMDYSEKSIELAKNILKNKFEDEEEGEGKLFQNIVLFQEDINYPQREHKDFDLIHDKGTFDAFMLLKDNSEKSYIQFIDQKSKSGCSDKDQTILIITSCNHSRKELELFFHNSKMKIIGDIPHKTFSFGGQVGQTVTTLIFKIDK